MDSAGCGDCWTLCVGTFVLRHRAKHSRSAGSNFSHASCRDSHGTRIPSSSQSSRLLSLRSACIGCAVRWSSRGSERRWKLGSSLAVALSVVVAFAAGICMIGVVHQSGWLIASEQPMMVEKETWRFQDNSRKNLTGLSLGLQNCLSSYGTFSRTGSKDWGRTSELATYASIYYGLSDKSGYGNKLELSLPWNAPSNQIIFRGVIPFLINPALPDAPLRQIQTVTGSPIMRPTAGRCGTASFDRLNEFSDGIANTILIGEVNATFRPWGDPGNVRDPARGVNRSPYGFGGPPGTVVHSSPWPTARSNSSARKSAPPS